MHNIHLTSRGRRWLKRLGARVRPKKGRIRGFDRKPGLRGWCLLGIGFLSLLWFLVRVIPKPSRAGYPCQRVAAPMAGSFVAWLLAVWASTVAWRKGVALSRRSRFGLAAVCLCAAMAGAGVAFLCLPESPAVASFTHAHDSLGIGQGIYPGRVVWVHAPEATDWAGPDSGQRWYDSRRTDLAVVEEMMSQVVRSVAGTDSDATAWEAIFRYFNQRHNRGQRGYQAGEKIAVKINLTGCNARGGSQVNLDTYEKSSRYLDWVDNSPQMILALLRQLVYQANVDPAGIAVGDPTGIFPKFMYDQLHPEFPQVQYFDNYGKAGSGRTRVEFSTKRFDWSTPAAAGKLQDFVPAPFAEADYVINFAVLKGHSCGFTVCAKNHYGSLLRCPDGYLRGAGTQNYYSMHDTLPGSGGSSALGHYRALVDLMGHPELGGKTLLYLVDGLYGGYYWEGKPYRWKTAPFGDGINGDWPSSLFASLDPVAIDSVTYDFLRHEWPKVVTGGTGAEGSLGDGPQDYLHEAAQADNPSSQSFYDPGKTGMRLASLGAHEHWNNATDKQYSRNLGLNQGIELVALKAIRPKARLAIEKHEDQSVLRWQGALTDYRLEGATSLTPPVVWTPLDPTPALVRGLNTVTNPIDREMRYYRLVK